MIIGLTGLIGSGKSEVARVWEDMGARVIDADRIGREVVENDSMVLSRLARKFGPGILNEDNSLNRRELGRRAFASPQKTALLNDIVHPRLLEKLDYRVAAARSEGVHAVVDAALLIYWNYQEKTDVTVLVTAYKQIRYQRLKDRGLSEIEIEQRTHSQLPLKELRAKSDIILTNNKNLEDIRRKARNLYRQLTERG